MGTRGFLSNAVGARQMLSMALTLVFTLTTGTPAAGAEACPNEQIRAEQVYGLRLPDCRAYEQVSPAQKNLTDAVGEPEIVQASPLGDGVSFFAVAPFPGTAGSGGQVPTYLSVRSPDDEWLTEGLLPEIAPGSDEQVIGLTEDLAKTILFAEDPPLAPGAELGARNAYVFDDASKSYRLLAANIGFEKFSFADATPGGSHILFETEAQLTKNAAPPVFTTCTSGTKPIHSGERVRLVGVLPDKEAPKGGSVAGPGGLAVPGSGSSTRRVYERILHAGHDL